MQPDQQQRIMGYFIEEAKDHLNTIEQGLLNLQSTIEDSEMINEVFRAAHSVKGGAAMLGLNGIQRVSHRLEDSFKVLKETPVQVDQKLENLFLRAFDALQELLGQLQGPFGLTEEVATQIVAGVEPTFTELDQHLTQLAGGVTPVVQPLLEMPVTSGLDDLDRATAQLDEALQQLFRQEVPLRLREMLQLFKQPETDVVSRQQLQELCRSLSSLGEQYQLHAWCHLVETARRAIAHSDNSYRILAPIVIKDIKLAQELVLAGQVIEISPCSQLRDLVPVPAEPAATIIQDDLSDLLASMDTGDALTDASLELVFDDLAATSAELDFGDALNADLANVEAGIRQGPEVGTAELNSLADLFEGEMPELGLTWQQEEVLTDDIASLTTDADLSAASDANDFADLLFDEPAAAAIAAASDDLSDLFGDDLDDISPQPTVPLPAPTPSIPETSAEDDFADLLGIGHTAEPDDELNLDIDLDEVADSLPMDFDTFDPSAPDLADTTPAIAADINGLSDLELDGALGDLDDLFDGLNETDLPTSNLHQTPSPAAIADPWEGEQPTAAAPSHSSNALSAADDTPAFLDFDLDELESEEPLPDSEAEDLLSQAAPDLLMEDLLGLNAAPDLSDLAAADLDAALFDDLDIYDPLQSIDLGLEMAPPDVTAPTFSPVPDPWSDDLSNALAADQADLETVIDLAELPSEAQASEADLAFDDLDLDQDFDLAADLFATEAASSLEDSLSEASSLVPDLLDDSLLAEGETDAAIADLFADPDPLTLAQPAASIDDWFEPTDANALAELLDQPNLDRPLDEPLETEDFDFDLTNGNFDFTDGNTDSDDTTDVELLFDGLSDGETTADWLTDAPEAAIAENLDLDALDLPDATPEPDLAANDVFQLENLDLDLDVAPPEAENTAATPHLLGLDDLELSDLELPDSPQPASDLATDLFFQPDAGDAPDELQGLAAFADLSLDDLDALDDLDSELDAAAITPTADPLSDWDAAEFSGSPLTEPTDDLADLDQLLEAPSELDASHEFGDLDSLLEASSATPTDFHELMEDAAAADATAQFFSDTHATEITANGLDDFSDLESLLASDAMDAEDTPAAIAHAGIDDSEFDDLNDLLKDAEEKMGGSPTVKVGAGIVVGRRTPRPGRVFSEQTMRVPVKHLDNLSNLVGELVVNRNSLEQDQERLRQSLDNLLYQVQQLSDVGQRMQDLYERSLLESSLLASRQNYRSAPLQMRTGDTTILEAPTDHSSGVEYDPLEMDRFTGFHSLSQEMIELIVRVRESSSDIEFIVDETEQVTRMFRQVTTQLQEGLTRSRMVPFAQTADRLPRAVRDISMKVGKQAELLIEGRETLIDKMILEQLYDPMTHLVNNAITHGIEPPAMRLAAGKPAAGRITIRAFHQGNQTIISVADDGAGIDVDRVKSKAVEKGLITAEDARTMSRLDVYDILFHPGFSTKDQADDFSGRGVGMDVVRTSLSEIRGVVNIDSTAGKGTSFTIRLPLTLSISKALCCISDRARIAFPMDGVEDMLDLPKDRIQTNADNRPCIAWRDTILTVHPLSELLGYNRHLSRGNVYGGNQEDDMVSVVVLRSAGNFLALQVDQVMGEQEIVIKQLEGPVPKPLGVAGATVLGDGRIMPIADVLELIDLSMGRIRRDASGSLWEQDGGAAIAEAPAAKTEPMVLIVDDSITVRELLSMTFNKVGYRVEQARDGQEAWEKLRSGLPCDIVFCDIEMPRMDGLELLSRIQKDINLKHLPIAMLTSRGADRHRQMAASLGASGYFTKPYLEEALLDAAQRMLKGERLLSNG